MPFGPTFNPSLTGRVGTLKTLKALKMLNGMQPVPILRPRFYALTLALALAGNRPPVVARQLERPKPSAVALSPSLTLGVLSCW